MLCQLLLNFHISTSMARVLFEKTTKFVEIKNQWSWMGQAFFFPTFQYWKSNCRISWICSNKKNPKISCLKKMTNFIRKTTDHGWSKETPERREAWKENSTQITELITSPLVIARPILGPFWDLFLGQFWSPLPNVACFFQDSTPRSFF